VRNRGELAEGWYDPATLHKAQAAAASYDEDTERAKPRDSPTYGSPRRSESSDEDLVGPALPDQEVASYNKGKRRGPAIPDTQDLELRRGEIHVKNLIYAFILKQLLSTQSSSKKTPSPNVKTSATHASSIAPNRNTASTSSFPAPKPAAKTAC